MNISIQKWVINYFKIKSSHLSESLVETMPFVINKSRSKKGLRYLKDSPYSIEVQWDISDLPFVQKRIINIRHHLYILR